MDLWQILEIVGAAIGLFYLWLEYRASIWLWVVGIIMPAIYIYVYYKSGFYADVGINIYYLLAGIYGWLAWMGKKNGAKKDFANSHGPKVDGTKSHRANSCGIKSDGSRQEECRAAFPARTIANHTATAEAEAATGGGTDGMSFISKIAAIGGAVDNIAAAGGAKAVADDIENDGIGSGKGEALPVSRMPRRAWLPAMAVGLAFFAAIAWILINFTDSTVPYGDSFTTAFSIVALWMLSRKYAEQWLIWLVVDLICSGLYFYKGLYPTAALYGLYGVIAVFGYIKWLKMIDKQNETGVTGNTDARG